MHDRYRTRRTMQSFKVNWLFDKLLGVKSNCKEEAQCVSADMSRCGQNPSISPCSDVKEDQSTRILPCTVASSSLELKRELLLHDSKKGLQNFVYHARLSEEIQPGGSVPSADHLPSSVKLLQNSFSDRSILTTSGQPSTASLDVMEDGCVIPDCNQDPSDGPVMCGNRVASEMQSPNLLQYFPGVTFSEPMFQMTRSSADKMSAVAACAPEITEPRIFSDQQVTIQPVRRVRSILKLGGDARPEEATAKRNSSDVPIRQDSRTEMTQGAQSDSRGQKDMGLMGFDGSEVLMLPGAVVDRQQQDSSSPAATTMNSPNLQRTFTQDGVCDMTLSSADFLRNRSSKSLLSTGGPARGGHASSSGCMIADGIMHASIPISADGLESREALRVWSEKETSFESEFGVDENLKSLSMDERSAQHMHMPIAQAGGSLVESNGLRLDNVCQHSDVPASLQLPQGCNMERKRRSDDVFWMRCKDSSDRLDRKTVLTSWGLEIPVKTLEALEHMTQVRTVLPQELKC